LARGIHALHLDACLLQPCGGRRQPEWLSAEVVRRYEQNSHSGHCTGQLPTTNSQPPSWKLVVGSWELFFVHGDAGRRTIRTSRTIRTNRTRVFRPPAWTFDAFLHGDVGALQLLRDARVPHLLHDGV